MEILCFFAGIAFFYFKTIYPLCFLCAVFFIRTTHRIFLWFSVAMFWCLLHQWWIADEGMPSVSVIKKANLQGYIASIPTHSPDKTQFQFFVETLDNHPVTATVLLSCYDHCPNFQAGQSWQVQAKLKKPVNLANPGGFDYIAWLHARHVNWVGTIYRNTARNLNKKLKYHSLIQRREQIATLLERLNFDEKSLGIFQALTLGLTTHIDKRQWDLFRRTGTTHLIDISGEHIALIGGFTYWLLSWGWKSIRHLCLYYPAPKIASIGAMIVAWTYALITGFAVPTQRALITCCLLFFSNFCNQRISIWQIWRYALFLVLVYEPHAVFMLGFYFSFIAVAILILVNQRTKFRGIAKLIAMQLACLVGLIPLNLFWFSYASLNGLLANLVAIPWVSFFIVPLGLVIAFFSPWFIIPGSTSLLNWLISCLLGYLEWIDSYERFNIIFTFKDVVAPIALMLALSLIMFLPLPRLFAASVILIITSFFPRYEKLERGEAKIDVLDVGQGLAVVIRTAKHSIVYDTGMKFYRGGDMGTFAIIPYLNTLGIHRLDKVIISHPDLDHRGGLASLEARYRIKELIVDNPKFYKRGVSCHYYSKWEWDGVVFQFFPILPTLKGKNNNSCILQIANQAGKVLLTGDIEQPAEQYLIDTYGSELASAIMLVPHHGSKTSSSHAFLSQIAPQYAIASYGFDNSYHFPHQQTIQAYQHHHTPVYNTLDCGMVSIHLQGDKLKPTCYNELRFKNALWNV